MGFIGFTLTRFSYVMGQAGKAGKAGNHGLLKLATDDNLAKQFMSGGCSHGHSNSLLSELTIRF